MGINQVMLQGYEEVIIGRDEVWAGWDKIS